MGTLKIMNYDNVECDTGVDLEKVNSLYVVVVSGDEIVTVVKTDGMQKTFDSAELSGNGRVLDFFDGEYGVHKDDLAEWVERDDSYSWFGRMQKDATV